MNSDDRAEEQCAVCGKGLAGVAGTIRVYHDSRRFALCCPLCLDLFQRAPARFARGEKPQTVIEDLLDQLKWRDP
ncbi:MAG: hypothetical protein C0502_07670 [Opitutus sp.]|nr:hypothetical protein [Opitutus sp.]